MKKIFLWVLGGFVLFVVIAAIVGDDPNSSQQETSAATPTAQAPQNVARPGSATVYRQIAQERDCAALQETFDRAEATSKRPGGPASATWSRIGIAYMDAADDRMRNIGCYG